MSTSITDSTTKSCTDSKSFLHGLNPEAPVFIPKFSSKLNQHQFNNAVEINYELDSEDDFENEHEVNDEFDYDSSSSDENSHILYDGKYFIYAGTKYDSYDKAHDAKSIDENEYMEISAMITASMDELSCEC
jgi:hypothetical protein